MIRFVLVSADGRERHSRDRRSTTGWGWLLGLATLQREFPSLTFKTSTEVMHIEPAVSVRSWRAVDWDPADTDGRVLKLEGEAPLRLNIVGEPSEETAAVALEVLTRYQSMIQRLNEASSAPAFLALLRRHREFHDLHKPLVRADYLHALDAWQWVLRLQPRASLPVQIAALFPDIERLVSEPDVRLEQHAPDYDAFKAAHARSGAAMTVAALEGLGLSADTLARVQELVRHHERPGADEELALLNDADALSFMSLNSAGFLDYYGPEHTRTKIVFTLRRLRRTAWPRLRAIRYRADFERLLVEAMRTFSPSGPSGPIPTPMELP